MSVAEDIQAVLDGTRRWVVIEGDCLAVMPMLGDKSVDHVITDPPYEAEAHTQQRRKKTEGGGGVFGVASVAPLDFLPITETDRERAAAQVGRLVRRWTLAFCQVEASQRWRAAFDRGGLAYRRTAIWVKPDGQPQLSGDRPGMGYESIAVCHAIGRSRWNGGGRTGVFTHPKEHFGEAAPHPTTKPIELMLELVSLFTDPDELILDPFCGSGTTGVACLRLGRRFIGIEKDAKYAAISRERLAAEDRGLSLRDARAGQTSIFDLVKP